MIGGRRERGDFGVKLGLDMKGKSNERCRALDMKGKSDDTLI
jgi:hypothetical protein